MWFEDLASGLGFWGRASSRISERVGLRGLELPFASDTPECGFWQSGLGFRGVGV